MSNPAAADAGTGVPAPDDDPRAECECGQPLRKVRKLVWTHAETLTVNCYPGSDDAQLAELTAEPV